MRPLHLVVLPLLCSTVACFARGREPPTPAPSTTTVQAVEHGCPYTEPAEPARAKYKVTLTFLVLKNGAVEPSSVAVIQSRYDTRDQTFIKRAMEIARGCMFQPALSGGQPVESTVRKRFYFNED